MFANCIICSDAILTGSDIYSTTCGHLFHYACLFQWLERAKTCPQCRGKVTEKTVHKIYINQTNTDHIVDDVGTLQNKVDNVQFQLNLKEKDVRNLTDKCKKIKSQNASLREEVAELEKKIRVHDSIVIALKDQISFFKTKSKERDNLIEEVARMKARLKHAESMQTAITGTREEVNDMLKSENDKDSLVLLAASLKKALLDAEAKKRSLEVKFKHIQNDISKYRKEINALETSNKELRIEIKSLKTSWEQEKKSLKNMVPDVNLSTRKRMLLESPVPLTTTPKNSNDSISVEQKVVDILDSSSPYLRVQTNSISHELLSKGKSQCSPNATKMSIFRKTVDNSGGPVKRTTDDVVYNGLGGRNAQDTFPSPRGSFLRCQKHKANSTLTLSSAKFRKLNPAARTDKL